MMDRNPQALSLAYKKCRAKILKIQELGIEPDMTEEQVDSLIERLATAKAVETSTDISEHVKGQRFYVEGLVRFSAFSTDEQLDSEYNAAFADTASEAEMLAALRAI